ncbi:hypothetical protein [Streptomyces albogriseolus]|uniref:hypothetical protein n=1 Tax=Streptomyces albogriseolus TaxID=1887 RepID=UPI001FE701AA|nr:hypothetical protein [Streptomyces viridodiastaticus]
MKKAQVGDPGLFAVRCDHSPRARTLIAWSLGEDMSKQIVGWIMDRNLRAFLELLSRYIDYAFDDIDWDTIETGVRDTDDEKSDGWYSYPLAGTSATLEVGLARSVGSEVMSVSVTGVETPELQLRTDTLLSAFASI